MVKDANRFKLVNSELQRKACYHKESGGVSDDWHAGCVERCRSRYFITGDAHMRVDDRADLYGRRDHRTGFERLASSALDYLRSRGSDHWIMFFAGLVVGLFFG